MNTNMRTEKTIKAENIICALTGALVLWGALALLFDFYYDLNDDVLIKDILSGSYTGNPEAHNNQMLYPISVIIAGLYRLTDSVPWFGFLEIACMVCSFILMGYIILGLIGSLTHKVMYIIFQSLLFFGVMMWELVNIQYTVVSGILTVAAAVWLNTGEGVMPADSEKSTYKDMGGFVKRNIPAIILTVCAFNIRSELVLLLSPILAAVAISKWCDEKKKTDAPVISGYLGVFLCICLFMLISLCVDRAAYGSDGWKEYRRFFDARTQLYDFTGLPDYEENTGFYEEENITREEYELLKDYNYYLDPDIDADMLESIANGVKSGRARGMNTYGKSIKEAAWEYVHGMLDFRNNGVMSTEHLFANEADQNRPFNIIVLIMYAAVAVMSIVSGRLSGLVKAFVFFVFRTVPWMYVYLQGRVLSRITHPLYMLEIMALAVILITGAAADNKEIHDPGTKTASAIVYMAILTVTVICLINIPHNIRYLRSSGRERAAVNESRDRLYEYTAAGSDTYYYIDTYSTVDHTEKIFKEENVSKVNVQLLGGWMGNSPLEDLKRSLFDREEYVLRDEYLALTKDDN